MSVVVRYGKFLWGWCRSFDWFFILLVVFCDCVMCWV